MDALDDRGSVAPGESLGTDATPEELAQAIGLDAEEIQWRKDFVGFDGEDAARLEALQPVVEAREDDLVDAFLEPIYETDETREITDRSPRDDAALRAIVSGYYKTAVGGQYDREYFKHRTRIGRLHDRLDMPLHYFSGMFGNVLNVFVEEFAADLAATYEEKLDEEAAETAIAELEDTEAMLTSVVRILNLDMQVVNDTYLHSYAEKMREEIEKSQQMRADVGDSVDNARDSFAAVEESVTELAGMSDEFDDDVAAVANELSDLSATIEEIAASSTEASGTSNEARGLVDDGQAAASGAVESIEDVDDARDEIADDIDELVDAIDQIDDIVEVIDGIADETNMLALNASIEAARAGEAGSGFAVVADEVKALAEEAQTQATEIEGVIDDVSQRIDATTESLEAVERSVTESVEAVETTEDTLDDIGNRVDRAAGSMEEVANATDQQATSTAEVSSMVDGLGDRAGDIATEIESIASEVSRQDEQMQDIRASTDRLRSLDEIRFGGVTDAGEWEGERHETDVPGRFDSKRATDGGVAERATDRTGPVTGDDIPQSLRDRLPEGIPDHVVEMLDRETLEGIADGDIEKPF
jgi:methyl-accepting chemotaxis protein